MNNPILGSDIDIIITLKHGESYITSGVDFELSFYDSYNRGKVWKWVPPVSCITHEGNTWKIRFPADKQKYAGTYNVLCTVDMSAYSAGTQQVAFKNAFYLEDPILPSVGPFRLNGEVQATMATLKGSLDVSLIVSKVDYNQQTMVITITFTSGTVVSIDAHNIFPFRVMTEAQFEALTPAQLLENVFYYTYDEEEQGGNPEVTPVQGGYNITFSQSWGTFTPADDGEYDLKINTEFNVLSTGRYNVNLFNLLIN